MIKTCEMTMANHDLIGNCYFKCGKSAKYITPEDPIIKGKRMYVCGTHKNSVDALHKRIGSEQRCQRLEAI